MKCTLNARFGENTACTIFWPQLVEKRAQQLHYRPQTAGRHNRTPPLCHAAYIATRFYGMHSIAVKRDGASRRSRCQSPTDPNPIHYSVLMLRAIAHTAAAPSRLVAALARQSARLVITRLLPLLPLPLMMMVCVHE
jgi:hypothetical protein